MVSEGSWSASAFCVPPTENRPQSLKTILKSISTHPASMILIRFNNKLFYLVIVLILILPIGKHADLFLFGKRTEGIPDHYSYVYCSGDGMGGGTLTSMVFNFYVENKEYSIEGPANVKYGFNEKCKIIYKKNNPSNCIIPSFSYLYLSYSSGIYFVELIIWIAFYTSFFNCKERKKSADNQNNLC